LRNVGSTDDGCRGSSIRFACADSSGPNEAAFADLWREVSVTKRLALKIALAFAIVGYLVACGLYFSPARWHPSPSLVFTLCPPAFLTITVDPSFTSVAVILGPLNAVIYGVVGLLIGLAVEEIRNWKSDRGAS
jgi:hypothetical protein